MRYKLYKDGKFLGDIWAGMFDRPLDVKIVGSQWNFFRPGDGLIASLICDEWSGLMIVGERFRDRYGRIMLDQLP
jgi:hypothetical protein